MLYVTLKKEDLYKKKQEVKGLLGNLGTRTFLSKIPVLRDILF